MVALKDYEELINAALESKVDAIISGAGLPLRLPELVKDHDVLIAPIVSSGKACKVIIKHWLKNINVHQILLLLKEVKQEDI